MAAQQHAQMQMSQGQHAQQDPHVSPWPILETGALLT
jgi:hypothetical protein